MNWGGLLFLSGVTDMTHVTFDEQFPSSSKRLTDTLADGGGSWDKVQRATFLLHHDEKLDHLRVVCKSRGLEFPNLNTPSSVRGRASGSRSSLRRAFLGAVLWAAPAPLQPVDCILGRRLDLLDQPRDHFASPRRAD